MTKWPKGFAGFDKADDFFKNQFDKGANEALLWLHSAEVLKDSADVLSPYIERSWELFSQGNEQFFEFAKKASPYMLLCGYAIENLLKGIIIAKGTIISVNGRINLKFRTHSLNDLVKVISDQSLFSSDEIDLCQRLERFTITNGRYPVPLAYIDIKPQPFGGKPYTNITRPADIDLINKLYEKLKNYLTKLRNN